MWSGDGLDLGAYLTRIGYGGELRADLRTLQEVHRCHTRSIPFENLDVALGRGVPLDVKSLEDKLVRQRRGGYCYEQNSLLAAALERIGFEVAGRGARNRTRGDALLPVTHALLVVTVDGRPWLADAGFGVQGPTEPLLLEPGTRSRQGEWGFSVAAEDDGVLVLRSRNADGERDLYAFAPQRLHPVDFELMNHYSATHPKSFFTGRALAMRTAPERRTAFVDGQLIVFRPDGGPDRSHVASDDVIGLLDQEFGISLPEADARQLLRTYWPGL
ncbi:arylamine N-acetyltransferase [Streptomyces bambusae]|uniref:arylamine N-acetyltransferase family protein n=1 Tax=Streptomyces bambusae TaxID=1550616 RepID=UPI001CFD3E99|nr:arylamine N-acetyltransferase [Streptomyces bambusae]MCB5163724.1 arylamine N-acetyltransferase [Streptomyces bambusae]